MRSIPFETKEEVDDYFSGDEIECLLCGRRLRMIGGSHLSRMHQLSVQEYKYKFGLPNGKGLVCDKTRENFRNGLIKRIESGDDTLTPFTPELAWKAQHAPKRQAPPYAKKAVQKRGLAGLKKRAEIRAKSVDWNKFLNEVRASGVGHWGMRGRPGIPSGYDLTKKLKRDAKFQKEYFDLLDGMKLSSVLSGAIKSLRDKGMGFMKIAGELGISKTHCRRIATGLETG
jgi:hypothetical protein